MNRIKRTAAYIFLVCVYGFTWLVAILGSIVPRRPWKPTGRILVTGTFHNPGWYLSHITPLTCSGMKEVVLVIDEPQMPLVGVRFACPPKWMSRILSRAGAKALWMIVAGLRYRPDLYMGYHIIPGGCAAMVTGKLLGRPCCYQMTGAPAGLIGGFPEIVCSFETGVKPSKLIEAMALSIVRRYDCVVVRGNKSRRYLMTNNIKRTIAIITGSVKGCPQASSVDRSIHLAFVGRLSPVKQVDQFIKITKGVSQVIPHVKAVIVGDGPLMADLKAYTHELGLTMNISFLGRLKDVEEVLTKSKIFVLNSKTEGLSIAMAEAMSVGAVPVVADVGELGDLVIDGVNGYLVEPNNIAAYSKRIISLLQDDTKLNLYSQNAIEAAKKQCHIEVIAAKWQRLLQECVESASAANAI